MDKDRNNQDQEQDQNQEHDLNQEHEQPISDTTTTTDGSGNAAEHQEDRLAQMAVPYKQATLADHYDYLIVGAGLFGSIFTRFALDAYKTCLVIDCRDHLGGNLYCEKIAGITVHRYGAHIFQPRHGEIFQFAQRYANWRPFEYGYVPVGGYNKMIANLLDGATTVTGITYKKLIQDHPDIADKVIYTGPIDAFFDYRYGRLDYYSMQIEHEVLNQEHYQDTGICLESTQPIWTRTVEFKYLTGETSDKTVLSRESLLDGWDPDLLPCRPRNEDEANHQRYLQYVREAEEHYPNVIFCGRLGSFQPYDMSDTIAEAMKLAARELYPE